MTRTARIFWAFLWRDAIIYWKRKQTYIVNYMLLYPALYAFVFLYIGPQIFFGTASSVTGTTLFVGNILLTLMTLTYKLNIGLLFDFEQQRFIDYQITLLPPRYVLLERMIFSALFTFVLLAPYFPLSKILLQDYFVTTHTSWIMLEFMLAWSALFCSAYHVMISSLLKSSSTLTQFWVRLNQPLLILGGFWVPHTVISEFSPLLGYLCYLNPFTYVTEGMRQAILGSPHFLSIATCMGALSISTLICVLLSFYLFKRKTDHI